ncbi:Mu transposase C-terminal domain-containing protein [Ensifer adhaerens]|uniref:Mu transposase C-terminal domain-containing protein n=1 Tax=Ensifer adhaerens TaxID=106592 RepID=UPI000FDA2FC0|nr:Mu transposase C-terminal domain-containing protein [Ensifer adhaerens]MDF8357622.1 Mu transposase C-terminal domain-containing protein [Ensifer adhaerens]THA60244.1 hypothetical protein E5176_29685 [Ensifer adhaerens]
MARSRGPDSASTTTRSNAFLVDVPTRAGAHAAANRNSSVGLRYWSAALSADVGRAIRRLLVKYDPRDMARVFVRRPSGNFVEARYADVTLPSVTLHDVSRRC